MIPPRIALWLGGIGSLLIALSIAHYLGYEEGYDVRAAEEAKRSQARQGVVIDRHAEVISVNQSKDDKAQKVDHETQDRLVAAVADRDRSRAAVAGLRNELDRVRTDAMSETATRSRLAAEVSAATNSLSECSGRYSALADQSDQLSIQVSGLLELVSE